MIASHIHDALRQVQELRRNILEKQRFKGYSGRARAISGTLALGAAFLLAFGPVPQTFAAHFLTWGIVFLLAGLLNFGAIIYWFLFDPAAGRNLRRLKPVVDVLAPLILGGILTLVFLSRGMHDDLAGLWMCLFGLAHVSARHTLPRGIVWVGLFYIVAGALELIWLKHSFLNPWPMGLVFFVGEWTGGTVLHFDDAGRVPLPHFLQKEDSHATVR